MKKDTIKKIVKDAYKEIAVSGSGCGCSCNKAKNISKSIGYTEEELKIVGEANLGLGCGHPFAFGKIIVVDFVLDLGSGAGIDAILAAQKVGEKGKVFSFEPDPENFQWLSENININKIKNIKTIKIAVGEKKKEVLSAEC